MLATEAVRDAASDGYEWSFAGEKRLKGLSAPLRTYRAQAYWGRVSAFTKSSSWRVVQHS